MVMKIFDGAEKVRNSAVDYVMCKHGDLIDIHSVRHTGIKIASIAAQLCTALSLFHFIPTQGLRARAA